MTTAIARAAGMLAGHVRLIRAAADLIEQAGIPGLTLFPWQDEIVIQVPETSGSTTARLQSVARIAALAGARATPAPGQIPGRVSARGEFAGHPVHVYTPVTEEAS